MTEQEYRDAAQRLTSQIETIQQQLSSSQAPVANAEWWSTNSAMTMCASILVFGSLICIISAMLLRKGQDADGILRTFGTILIIVSSLFLVVAGYNDRQIAPVVGLLGTLAGYLLGKPTISTAKKESKTQPKEPAQGSPGL